MIDATLLQRLVDNANDGIVVAEQEGDENILIYVNHAFETLTGYTADEILYQDCRFLQCGDHDQPGIDNIRKALRKNLPACEVIRNYRKDGTMFWNELRLTPVFDDEEQLMYYIGIQKDVTELVEAKQKLKAMKEISNKE